VAVPAHAASDTTPPATPGGFQITQRSGTNVTLNWNWTADVGGYVASWELVYAGQTVAINHNYPGHTQSVANLNLSPGNAYTFKLYAKDNSGNRSLVPAQLVFETTPPATASNLQVLSTRQGYPDLIGFTAATDNSGSIWGYEVFLNGESLGITQASSQFSLYDQAFLIACIEPTSGPNTLRLRAIDASHNPSTQLSAPFTVVFP
jgi:hypothetical protein